MLGRAPGRAAGRRRSRGGAARRSPGAPRRSGSTESVRSASRPAGSSVPSTAIRASRPTCHSASRAKLRPQVRTSAAWLSGVRMPRSTSSRVRRSASMSSSVKATSSSAACGKPSCCQSRSASANGHPAFSLTSPRVQRRPAPSRVSSIAPTSSACPGSPPCPRRQSYETAEPLVRGAVEGIAERRDPGTEPVQLLGGEVQRPHRGRGDDRGVAELVVDQRRLPEDVARAEGGDLPAAAAYRRRARQQDVGLVGRGLLLDGRPVRGQADGGPGGLDLPGVLRGEAVEDAGHDRVNGRARTPLRPPARDTRHSRRSAARAARPSAAAPGPRGRRAR